MRQTLLQQFFPIFLTVITFFALSFLLYNVILLLNLFPLSGKIIPHVSITDILIGLSIYLKTSVDFAIFIGNLMAKNPGWKNRIAIEIGTALGNASGTFFVLLVWTFFKEVPFLMILMIFLAALVLLSMAEEGLAQLIYFNKRIPLPIISFVTPLLSVLNIVTAIFNPIIKIILPRASAQSTKKASFATLGLFAFTVPLLLGLDDFAGYIPLFTIINVFGFSIGVFLGHMLLNVALFASPRMTISLVRHPLIILFGSLAFLGIALWGFVEIFRLSLPLFLR